MPPPQMTILNAPFRDACVARRERTNTPTQALLLLNESEYLNAARQLAVVVVQQPAEQRLEFISYATLVAATSNDAYNTLVTTDLAPEFGRDNVFQVMRENVESARHQLPPTLGGRKFGPQETHRGMERRIRDGWTFRITRLTDEFTFEDWRKELPDANLVARISPNGTIKLIRKDKDVNGTLDVRIIALRPPDANTGDQPPAQ